MTCNVIGRTLNLTQLQLQLQALKIIVFSSRQRLNKQLSGIIRLSNVLLHVEWDVKPYSLNLSAAMLCERAYCVRNRTTCVSFKTAKIVHRLSRYVQRDETSFDNGIMA